MTEPRWRDVKTITEEMYGEGQWIWKGHDGWPGSANPRKMSYGLFTKLVKSRQAYGPIPDPPEPPPKLRRFEATLDGKRVSGVSTNNREWLRYWRWHDREPVTGSHPPERFTDIEWLDPEEP